MTERRAALPGMLGELREFLARGLPEAEVTTDYPFQQRRLPPDRAVVWLGVEKLTARGGGFAPYLGEEKGTAVPVAGREVEVTLRVEVLHRLDGNVCHRLFGELCQRLLLEEGRPRVGELSCGGVAFDREAGAFRLVCKGTLRGVLAQSEEGRALREIVVERDEGREGPREGAVASGGEGAALGGAGL